MLHSVWQIECIGKKEKRMLELDYSLLQLSWQVIIIPKIKAKYRFKNNAEDTISNVATRRVRRGEKSRMMKSSEPRWQGECWRHWRKLGEGGTSSGPSTGALCTGLSSSSPSRRRENFKFDSHSVTHQMWGWSYFYSHSSETKLVCY